MDKKTVKLSKNDWLSMGQELGYLPKQAGIFYSHEMAIRSICSDLDQFIKDHSGNALNNLKAEDVKQFEEAVDRIKRRINGESFPRGTILQ
jgi:hypothetical protein